VDNTPDVIIRQLGPQPYVETWSAMRRFTDQRQALWPDEIWFCEHESVYTQGLNGKPQHILDAGTIPVVQVDRGGQITYHGPGQLVGYIMMDIKRRQWGIRRLVSGIEQALVDLLASYQIPGYARAEAPGVYVDGAKIAALGLRVRRGGSYHGFSLNVDMDLTPFQRINPCGYAGMAVSQIAAFRPGITVAQVISDLTPFLSTRLALYPNSPLTATSGGKR